MTGIEVIESANHLPPGHVWVHNVLARDVLTGDRIISCYTTYPVRNTSWEKAGYTLGVNLKDERFNQNWPTHFFSVQRPGVTENEFGTVCP